jgi:hypothetical protein
VKRFTLVLACAVAPSLASADVSNPDFMPFGERAGMLGNAGLTSPFGEAVFYNPANLTRLDHPTLTVSGTTYLRFNVSVHPAYTIGTQELPIDASGFLPIPSSVISTHRVGSWTLATAILVPEALEFKKVSGIDTTSGHLTLLQQQSAESLWIGGSAARALGSHLSIGVSLFGSRLKEASFNVVRLAAGPNAVQVTTNLDTQVLNLSALLGVYWEPDPKLGLAVRVRSPTLRLAGTTDSYLSTIQVGDMPAASEQSVEAKAYRPFPTDVGVGVAARPWSHTELVADVGLQLPRKVTQLDDPVAGTTRFDVHLAPRVGVGADLEIADHAWLRIGGSYNRSALDAPKTANDQSRDTYFGMTGGLAYQKERTLTSLGLFVLESHSDKIVSGADPPRLASAHILLYGGMLSFSYRL